MLGKISGLENVYSCEAPSGQNVFSHSSNLWDGIINNTSSNVDSIAISQTNKLTTKEAQEKFAHELFEALNNNDKNTITKLLKMINKDNIRNIYHYYQKYAESKGEVAATEKEVGYIKNKHSRKAKAFGMRTETLLQGILNNKALSLEEKRMHLTSLVNLFASRAEDYFKMGALRDDKKSCMTKELINTFKTNTKEYINSCTRDNRDIVLNTKDIEDEIAKLFGYYKKN